MSNLDTIARAHAEQARVATAAAQPPQIDVTVGRLERRDIRPRPDWRAAVVALVGVLVLGLPFLLVPRFVGDSATTSSVAVDSTMFVPTASLQQGCAWCPAVLLDDGRVLVLGGWSPTGDGSLPPAEIYDPATGSFSSSGTPRGDFNQGTAVVLGDGRVLVIYGLSTQAEIYDPVTGEFHLTAITYPQGQDGVAVGLADGRVMALGYDGSSGIFDPVADSFTSTAAVPSLDGVFDAVLLETGEVLVIGGSRAVVYDPISNVFEAVGDLNVPRSGHTVTRLADGRVAVIGGAELTEPYDLVAQTEVYEPSTRSFIPAGSLNLPRSSHAAALLADGRVLVVGGSTPGLATPTDVAEVFDPSTNELTLVEADMTGSRVAGTAVTLRDGRVLVFGHYPGNFPTSESSASSNTAELFQP